MSKEKGIGTFLFWWCILAIVSLTIAYFTK